MADYETKTVRLLTRQGVNNAGETCSFEVGFANQLIATGRAVAVAAVDEITTRVKPAGAAVQK